MDHLWTPWRYVYLKDFEQSSASGCLFCAKSAEKDDERNLIVHRGRHNFIILNAYPYTTGHAMVVPFEHVAELQRLSAAAGEEMMALLQKLESTLRELYRPEGLNLGMNIGRAAGAGVAGHLHMHILPRWVADSNFMTVVGETRVLPEELTLTFRRMKERLKA